MKRLAYTVTATFPDLMTRDAYIDWLRGGHVDAVIAGGALTGEIVAIEEPGTPIRVETRYWFADRAGFDRYVRDTAPALRADGLERFPPERGITFERRIGRVY